MHIQFTKYLLNFVTCNTVHLKKYFFSLRKTYKHIQFEGVLKMFPQDIYVSFSKFSLGSANI